MVLVPCHSQACVVFNRRFSRKRWHASVVNTQTFPHRECFKHALLGKYASEISQAYACSEFTAYLFREVSRMRLWCYTSFRYSKVSQVALVVNTQALTFRGCFEPALVMNTLGVFPACTCSRCASLLASGRFQACACGDTQVFASREYLELTLGVNIQAFASQECFKLCLW